MLFRVPFQVLATGVKDWYVIIGEKTIADAILDRIVHQAVRVELTRDSLRKKNIKKESVYL